VQVCLDWVLEMLVGSARLGLRHPMSAKRIGHGASERHRSALVRLGVV
jgi:hypothetical protein